MKCPYARLEYDKTYNQWYGFDEEETSTTICHQTAENYKRLIPFKLITKPTQYQARLDKVLAKFEEVSGSWLDYNKNGIEINYNAYGNNQFTTEGYRKMLKLDTVELLIRDMEAQNETN